MTVSLLVLCWMLIPADTARAENACLPEELATGRAIEYLKRSGGGMPDEVIAKVTARLLWDSASLHFWGSPEWEAHKGDISLPILPDQSMIAKGGAAQENPSEERTPRIRLSWAQLAVGNVPRFDLPALRGALQQITTDAGIDIDPSVRKLQAIADAFRQSSKFRSDFPGRATDIIAELSGDAAASVFENETSLTERKNEEARARISSAIEYLAEKDAINRMASEAINQVIDDEVLAAINELERRRADLRYDRARLLLNADAATRRKFGEETPDHTDTDYSMIAQKIEFTLARLYSVHDRPFVGLSEKDSAVDYEYREADSLSRMFFSALENIQAANARTSLESFGMEKAVQFTAEFNRFFGDPRSAEEIENALAEVHRDLFDQAADSEDVFGMIKAASFGALGVIPRELGVTMNELSEKATKVFLRRYQAAVNRGDRAEIIKAYVFLQSGMADRSLTNRISAENNEEFRAQVRIEADPVEREIARAFAGGAASIENGLRAAVADLMARRNKLTYDINTVSATLDAIEPMVDDLPRAAEAYAEQKAESERRRSVGMFRGDLEREHAYGEQLARNARESVRFTASTAIADNEEVIRRWTAKMRVADEIRSDIARGIGTIENMLSHVSSAAAARTVTEVTTEINFGALRHIDQIRNLVGNLLPPASDALKVWRNNGDDFRRFLRVLRYERSVADDPSKWSNDRVEKDIPARGGGNRMSLRIKVALDQLSISGDPDDALRKSVDEFLAEWERLAHLRHRMRPANRSWPAGFISESEVEDIALGLRGELKTSTPWPDVLLRWAQSAAGAGTP